MDAKISEDRLYEIKLLPTSKWASNQYWINQLKNIDDDSLYIDLAKAESEACRYVLLRKPKKIRIKRNKLQPMKIQEFILNWF